MSGQAAVSSRAHHDHASAVLVALASSLARSLDALQLLLWAEPCGHVSYAQDPAHPLCALWVVTCSPSLTWRGRRPGMYLQSQGGRSAAAEQGRLPPHLAPNPLLLQPPPSLHLDDSSASATQSTSASGHDHAKCSSCESGLLVSSSHPRKLIGTKHAWAFQLAEGLKCTGAWPTSEHDDAQRILGRVGSAPPGARLQGCHRCSAALVHAVCKGEQPACWPGSEHRCPVAEWR